MSLLPFNKTVEAVPLQALTLDTLWHEGETLGAVHVRTSTGYRTGKIDGYTVTIEGKRRNSEIKVERKHTTLVCALADAINEAREMGLGETP